MSGTFAEVESEMKELLVKVLKSTDEYNKTNQHVDERVDAAISEYMPDINAKSTNTKSTNTKSTNLRNITKNIFSKNSLNSIPNSLSYFKKTKTTTTASRSQKSKLNKVLKKNNVDDSDDEYVP